jgi:hypothetical protein
MDLFGEFSPTRLKRKSIFKLVVQYIFVGNYVNLMKCSCSIFIKTRVAVLERKHFATEQKNEDVVITGCEVNFAVIPELIATFKFNCSFTLQPQNYVNSLLLVFSKILLSLLFILTLWGFFYVKLIIITSV